MKPLFYIAILWIGTFVQMFAQGQPLSYYLPADHYDPAIPSPSAFLGYDVGEWHISHDQLNYYLHTLAKVSERIRIQVYARSHENRPLLLLTISSPDNLKNLDTIKKQHQALCNPKESKHIDLEKLPAVILQGYTIHGNESSGANAAILVAYYLAASQSNHVKELLQNVVILLDPCFNPDGFHRFSTWVNMHKSNHRVSDTNSREFHEVWPGGRTNHYWFDLNRDWLLAVHPESQGRLKIFHDWIPNILTDHHEMGSDATYFFQPGIPSRTHPLTLSDNQTLTKKIGTFHAEALDALGSLYYSEESYDDFYYGKGSTYPDANGSIGILFEQASSRGHIRNTKNGVMSFAFTIRNQVATSLSTQKAALELRKELLAYKRDFFIKAKEDSKQWKHRAYIFGESHDHSRLSHFVTWLQRHQIEVYALNKDLEAAGKSFQKGKAYLIPMAQKQSRLIEAIFEKRTSFQDSLFYDVSAWTLPLAYNLSYTAVGASALSAKGKQVHMHHYQPPSFTQSDYAYLMEWDDYYAPRALYKLLENNIPVKVANKTFSMDIAGKRRTFPQGTLLIVVQNKMDAQPTEKKNRSIALYQKLRSIFAHEKINVYPVSTGLTAIGNDLGSNNFKTLLKPKVLLVGGKGARSYDVGEVWHLLDKVYEMPPVIVDTDRLGSISLASYNRIVVVSGNYGSISAKAIANLKRWIQNGGVLICSGTALQWAQAKGLANIEWKKEKEKKEEKEKNTDVISIRRPYEKLAADKGAQLIGGAIFQVEADLSHPLFYGFRQNKIPVFRRGTYAMMPAKNQYATPAVYSKQPLLSGYCSQKNIARIGNSAAITVSRMGKGRGIAFTDNLVFRGYFLGTNKVFANALFWGNMIDAGATE